MKRRLVILIAALTLMLTFVWISAVSAEPSESAAIACVLDITLDDYPDGTYWLGTLDDCVLEGAIEFHSVDEEYRFLPNVWHFVEEFTIRPATGGEIYGKNWGEWNLKSAKFRAHGWVTDASDEWTDLIGSMYHEMGVTSTTDVSVRPITAPDGSMIMAQGNRPVDSVP